MNRPLITIQVGNYSNYIGSHFWNLQESGFVYNNDDGGGQRSVESSILEVDNDVLYREGLTLDKQVTFTPRLISVDLKGSLGALPECGELYGKISIPKEESLSSFWSGGHQVFREEPFQKNEYLTELEEDTENVLNEKDVDEDVMNDTPSNEESLYNLEDKVNYWSDYLGAQFHPRSVLLCESYQHNNSMHPFDVWGLGREAWSDSSSFGDMMEDRIRSFAEECDVLGGFQIVSDYQDGFGGLSSSLMDLIGDEYSNKAVLSFPTSPAHYESYTGMEAGLRLAGAVLSLARHVQCSLVTPLTLTRDWWTLPGHVTNLPHVSYTPQSHYSSSSVLALALDTATLQYRRRDTGAMTMTASDVTMGLGSHGRRVASLATDIPMHMSDNPVQYFEQHLLSSTTSLLPGSTSAVNTESPYNALVSVRGMKSSALFSKRSKDFTACPDPVSYLQSCISAHIPRCRPVVSFATRPVNTGKPFPHIFHPNVNSFGEVSVDQRPANDGVQFTTAMTCWSAGPETGHSLASLNARAAKVNIAKLHRLTESGVESEEWSDAVETLRQQCDNYADDDGY